MTSCWCPGAGTHVTTLGPGVTASRSRAGGKLPTAVTGIARPDQVDRRRHAALERVPALYSTGS